MNPLISIITVTFNAGKVIGKTLESIAEQSFKDFEFLVIDGRSSDSTLEIIKEAEIPGTHILSEPDKGLYDAMNKGTKLAQGKYLIFLNAGDSFYDSETLKKYAQQALENKDIIYGDTIIVNTEGEKISDRHLKVPEKLTKNSFSNGMLVCHQAFMVKKELVPEYDLNFRFSADFDWCIKCIANSHKEACRNLNDVTIKYLSDGLTDHNKWKSLKERFVIMTRHYGFLKTSFRHIQFIFRALQRGKI